MLKMLRALASVAALQCLSAGMPEEADPCDVHMGEDLGWLQQYIRVGFFTDYRNLAWHYYATNETTYAFLWLNSISYANLDFLKEACPEAAFTALLLRAEERLPSREADLPLLELAMLQGLGSPARARWPIDLGLSRLRGLSAAMAIPEEYSVDVVMPYCNEPLDDLLSKKTGYEEEWLLSPVPLRHARLLLYRLESCVGAEGLEVLPPRAAKVASLFASLEVVPVTASPKAWEAARYFLHMARRYDSLADFTIVLHPDVFEHVNPRTLRNVLQSLRVGSFRQAAGSLGSWHEYLSLSHHYLMRPTRARFASANCTDVELGFQDLWQQLFGSAQRDLMENLDFGFYCCSQFLVHRDAVQRRPRAWYEAAVHGVAWEHCATSYMELLWHGIFSGGELHERKRQERTELPLFLRVDNFLETTSAGLV